MEIAAAEEGVGQVLLRIGGDDDDRPVFRRDGPVDLHDVELHLVEHVEHVILEIAVRLVDLVDEQDGPLLRDEGLADLAHADVILDAAHVPARIPEAAVVEAGQRVVLVESVHQLHAGFHVEDDQGHLQALGNGIGQHGLAGARLPLQEQRHFEGHGNVDDFGQFVVEDIPGSPPEAVCGIFLIHENSCLFRVSSRPRFTGRASGFDLLINL